MENFSLNINKQSLYSLMKNYYELSKIKTAIFDEKGYKIISYPENDCEFCSLMKSKAETKKLCDKSDKTAFEIVKGKREMIIYHCHANLVEASAPLIQDGTVIGYMMFGQITDETNKEQFLQHIDNLLDSYGFEIPKNDAYKKIKYRSENQIKAAAKLLEACTFYVLLKDMIKLRSQTLLSKINDFIDKNIDKDISITSLVEFLEIPKTRLYEEFNQYSTISIAKYIKNRRIEKAKELLTTTNLKIIEISEKVGFFDYNYFCRCFKKITGISAKTYRRNKIKASS